MRLLLTLGIFAIITTSLILLTLNTFPYKYTPYETNEQSITSDQTAPSNTKRQIKRQTPLAPFGKNNETIQWLKNYITTQMKERDIPSVGITVSIDKDTLYTDCYIKEGSEVYMWSQDGSKACDPRIALFKTGSVTKTFTALALLQLMEKGSISVFDAVENYLGSDFVKKVKDDLRGSPRIVDYLDHLGGLEESIIGLFTKDRQKVFPLADLKAHMPMQVFDTRATRGYSNHAVAAVGLIVQKIAGMDYYDYIDTHVLGPMGMNHSEINQDKYDFSRFTKNDSPYGDAFYLTVGPAGSLATTPVDMGLYLSTLLNDGVAPNGHVVLQEESIKRYLLNYTLSTLRTEPMAFGLSWYSQLFGGRVGLGHSGGIFGYSSKAFLVPELGLGLWVSCGLTGSSFPTDMVIDIENEFFPAPPQPAFNETVTVPDSIKQNNYLISARRSLTNAMMFSYNLRDHSVNVFKKAYTAMTSGPVTWDYTGDYVFTVESAEDANADHRFYPYLILGDDEGTYMTCIHAAGGFFTPTLFQDPIFVVIVYIAMESLYGLTTILYIIVLACCVPKTDAYDSLGEEKKPLSRKTARKLILLSLLLGVLIRVGYMVFTAVAFPNAAIGETAPLFLSTMMPICIAIVTVLNTMLLVYLFALRVTMVKIRMLFTIATVLNLLFIFLSITQHTFGPQYTSL